MKTLLLLTAATVLVGLTAAPAFATAPPTGGVQGTVDVQGSVDAKCWVASEEASTSFQDSTSFGELSNANGTLNTSVTAPPVSFEVLCNTGTPQVAISATQMTAQNHAATPPTGYTRSVGYTAEVQVLTAGSGPTTFGTVVAGDGTASADGALSSSGAVGDYLKVTASNLTVTASNVTDLNSGDILIADTSYQGTITVTVTPS